MGSFASRTAERGMTELLMVANGSHIGSARSSGPDPSRWISTPDLSPIDIVKIDKSFIDQIGHHDGMIGPGNAAVDRTFLRDGWVGRIAVSADRATDTTFPAVSSLNGSRRGKL